MVVLACPKCGELMPKHAPSKESWRRARRAWRQKRRATGLSWMCVLNNHGGCQGWVGRLMHDVPRPPCTCPCHSEDEA